MNAKPLLLALALSVVGSATPIKLFSGNCRADFEIGLAHNFLIAILPTTVHGNFNDFRGHIDYNPRAVESSSIDWRVNVDSINTGIAARDRHLASPDFFNTGKYPTLSFSSQSVHAVDPTHLNVAGQFTMMGVSKAISVPITVTDTGFDSEFSIKRSDYGFTAGLPAISDDVHIQLHVTPSPSWFPVR